MKTSGAGSSWGLYVYLRLADRDGQVKRGSRQRGSQKVYGYVDSDRMFEAGAGRRGAAQREVG